MCYISFAMKKLTSIRLSVEAVKLQDKLAVALGISKSAVIELAVRKLAKSENVSVKSNGGKS